MGIARINFTDAKNYSNTIKIMFKIGKVDVLWIHCKIYLSVESCQQSQKELFLHCGSRYGQVGSFTCEFCGASIAIVDNDNIVDSISVMMKLSFEKLYLLSADYIEWFQEWYGISLTTENLSEGWTHWMSVDQLREQIETLTGYETDSQARYQTDEKFNLCHPILISWIEFIR